MNNYSTQINTGNTNMTQNNSSGSSIISCRNQALNDAALEGNTDLLHELIKRDPYVLYRSPPSTTCIGSTTAVSVLHIACKIGHLSFVSELLRLRPDLSEQVDPLSSWTALHIACRSCNLEMVRRLISVNPKACFIRDNQGKNPVHIAAEREYCEILRELIEVSPDAARDRVGGDARGDTVMHLCVKHNNFDELKLLVEKVGDVMVLNAKDADGNNILHLAVILRRLEMITLLLDDARINKNVLNSDGLTPMDIHSSQRVDHNSVVKHEEVKSELKRAQALPASEVIKTQKPNYFGQWIEEERSSLMIVASLIATVAFQGCLSPPGGVWQENYGITKNRDLVNGYNPSPTPTPNNDIIHIAGTAIAAYNNPYHFNNFLNFNSIGLASSTIGLLLLISGLPWKRFAVVVVMVMMWIALASMTGAYLTSMVVLTLIPPTKTTREANGFHGVYVLHVRSTVRNQVTVGLLVCLGVILVVHFILCTMKFARRLRSDWLWLKLENY